MSWRYAYSSVIGTSHIQSNTVCQDYSICALINSKSSGQILLALVSDGAGSAKESARGSKEICIHIQNKVELFFSLDKSITDLNIEIIQSWLYEFQNALKMKADEEELTLRDFACTIVGLISSEQKAAFFQIGDGAIVISTEPEPSDYVYIYWPQQGQYANVTYFATDPDTVKNKLEFCFSESPVIDVALFSDGIQNLALHYQNKIAHSPFFTPLFTYLRTLPEGYSIEASNNLKCFLESDRVNEKTNDDKTLIMATRFK